jgi:hypothetical protein
MQFRVQEIHEQYWAEGCRRYVHLSDQGRVVLRRGSSHDCWQCVYLDE